MTNLPPSIRASVTVPARICDCPCRQVFPVDLEQSRPRSVVDAAENPIQGDNVGNRAGDFVIVGEVETARDGCRHSRTSLIVKLSRW
jgi:hypothetical protein